jgi:hypothetical protein
LTHFVFLVYSSRNLSSTAFGHTGAVTRSFEDYAGANASGQICRCCEAQISQAWCGKRRGVRFGLFAFEKFSKTMKSISGYFRVLFGILLIFLPNQSESQSRQSIKTHNNDLHKVLDAAAKFEDIFVFVREIKLKFDEVIGEITQLAVAPNGNLLIVDRMAQKTSLFDRGWEEWVMRVHIVFTRSMVCIWGLLSVPAPTTAQERTSPRGTTIGHDTNSFAFIKQAQSVFAMGEFERVIHLQTQPESQIGAIEHLIYLPDKNRILVLDRDRSKFQNAA